MKKEHQQDSGYDHYAKLLSTVGAFSRLFSESSSPYIDSRVAENVFCKAFNAENLSRSDVSADAKIDTVGYGIKTFLHKNGNALEKVAEFNSNHADFATLVPDKKILKIIELRNDRIDITKRIYGLSELLYHCVTREAGKIKVFETAFPLIDVSSLKNIIVDKNTIKFSDKHEEYSFNVSKSTLYKRFRPKSYLIDIPVKIITDPYDILIGSLEHAGPIFSPIKESRPHIYLPLYSIKNGIKYVPEKSGLNQWNAGGRPRGKDELYVPIPSWINTKFEGFFPGRGTSFELLLPNDTAISAAVCQGNNKALMSNPNSDLGKWLLRDVLNLKHGELITYERLRLIGLDSVVIYKNSRGIYEIDFAQCDSFDNFALKNSGKTYLSEE